MTGFKTPHFILTFVALIAFASNVAYARSGADRAYCGIYSIYAALQAIGLRPSFDELATPEYVSSRKGSTARDLVKAVEANGGFAQIVGPLSDFDLWFANRPVLLHVRSSPLAAKADHWVAYFGDDAGKAILVDGSRGQSVLSYGDLLSRWDGVGVVVAETEAAIRQYHFTLWFLRLLVIAAMAAVVLATCELAARLAPTASRLWMLRMIRVEHSSFAIPIFLVAFGVSISLHLVRASGLLRNPRAVASITALHANYHAREVTKLELVRLLENQSVSSRAIVLVDARLQRDFRIGHIPTAISYPIDADWNEERGILDGIPSHARIVVYCQSSGCQFDDAIASRLIANGFADVSVFAGGWQEWKAMDEIR